MRGILRIREVYEVKGSKSVMIRFGLLNMDLIKIEKKLQIKIGD